MHLIMKRHTLISWNTKPIDAVWAKHGVMQTDSMCAPRPGTMGFVHHPMFPLNQTHFSQYPHRE